MTIEIKIRGVSSPKSLHDYLAEQMKALEKGLPVTAAHVLVEQQRDVTPSCWICARLEVPGRDIIACGRDHTPQAAWIKVGKELDTIIKHRKLRPVHRRKSNLKLRADKAPAAAASRRRRP